VAVLIHHPPAGAPARTPFDASADGALLAVGSGDGSGLRLPAELGVAERHAALTYSTGRQVPVLVQLAGGVVTRVNGRRVTGMKALRHQDRIDFGGARVLFLEVDLAPVAPGSEWFGKKCLVCSGLFAEGDVAVACPRPRCRALHHAACWLPIPHCSEYACNYPVREVVRRVLAGRAEIEQLTAESELVREKKVCAACTRRRRNVAFQPHEAVVSCPKCVSPFHAECFFHRRRCPAADCGFDVAGLIHDALCPPAAGVTA
jgi:hypothetical protein